MESYNSKIFSNGKYQYFYGWTVISMLKNPMRFKFIYDLIKNDDILHQFFSPLPTTSYHMTILGIWNTGMDLLPEQVRNINKNYRYDEASELIENGSKTPYFFNPKYCINSLLDKIDRFINLDKNIKEAVVKIDRVVYTGSTIELVIDSTCKLSVINSLRDNIHNMLEVDRKYYRYHITLAYQYQNIQDDIDYDYVISTMEDLSKRLKGTQIEIAKPSLRYFSNMTRFIPYEHAKNRVSHQPINFQNYE
jgi:hypothetical protein